MSKIITLPTGELPILEYQNTPVITFEMVDEAHGRPKGSAKRNFYENKDYFKEGVDYFKVDKRELETLFAASEYSTKFVLYSKRGKPEIILLTQWGYLMIVKSLRDKLAWEVQRKLVASYFTTQKQELDIDSIFNNPRLLHSALLTYTQKTLGLEHQIEEQKPKVAFYDAVAEATNAQPIAEIAKSLGIGPKKLFQLLRQKGLFSYNNLPLQRYLDAGYFKVVSKKYQKPSGEIQFYSQSLVTGKGLIYLQNILAPLTQKAG